MQIIGGVLVLLIEADYLCATFTTRLMRFVDDAEFVLDTAERVIHLRSASRIGHGDRGVNRARIEAIRARFSGG